MDKRYDAGVGGWRRKTKKQHMVWRSLEVDHHAYVERAGRRAAQHFQRGGLSRLEKRRGMAAAVLMISRRLNTRYGGFE
jgi:hypothetical protein